MAIILAIMDLAAVEQSLLVPSRRALLGGLVFWQLSHARSCTSVGPRSGVNGHPGTIEYETGVLNRSAQDVRHLVCHDLAWLVDSRMTGTRTGTWYSG